MSTALRSPDKNQYSVGWICALPLERAAADAMLDERYESTHPQDPHDPNHYSYGRITGRTGSHNVVIASLPAGIYDPTSAAKVASEMIRSYPSINIRLMVGIGGCVPTDKNDIRLGDVVVSQPDGTFGGVVQYDRGKRTRDGKFERTGQLNKPPTLLLHALSAMQADFDRLDFDLAQYFHQNLKGQSRMLERYDRPQEMDDLYDPNYEHVEDKTGKHNRPCIRCSPEKLVSRRNRKTPRKVKFHYGTIASGNSVIKSATERDRISEDLGGILCFEMEAAGLMNDFPCLVIRGICDYADSHKNDLWHKYAAITAACYAKKLLSKIPGTAIQQHVPPYGQYPVASGPPSLQRSAFHPTSYSLPIQQPPYRQYGVSSEGHTSQFTEAPGQFPSQTISGSGQPIEQQRSISSDSIPPAFLQHPDFHQSPPRNYQPFQPPGLTPLDHSASGYNQSSAHYRTSPANQVQEGLVQPSAYFSSVTAQRATEGMASAHRRPPFAPNRSVYSDPELSRAKDNSAPPGGTPGKAKGPPFGGAQGYAQPPHMIYPQFPKPTHPDRSRQPYHGQSTPAVPLRPMPQPLQKQSQSGAPGVHYPKGHSHDPATSGDKGLGTSKSLDSSLQGHNYPNTSKQTDVRHVDRGQPNQAQSRTPSVPETNQKAPSYLSGPQPVATGLKESSRGLVPHVPVKDSVQRSRQANSNQFDKGHRKVTFDRAPKAPAQDQTLRAPAQTLAPQAPMQYHAQQAPAQDHALQIPPQNYVHQAPAQNYAPQTPPQDQALHAPAQNHAPHALEQDHVWQGHSQAMKPPGASSQEQSHHQSPKSPPKHSTQQDHLEHAKLSENKPTGLTNTTEPDKSERQIGEPPSSGTQNQIQAINGEYEPNEPKHERAPPYPNSSFHNQGYQLFSQPASQTAFSPGPPGYLNHGDPEDPLNNSASAFDGYPPPGGPVEPLNIPYTPSHKHQHPPYPSTNNEHHNGAFDIDHRPGGEAVENIPPYDQPFPASARQPPANDDYHQAERNIDIHSDREIPDNFTPYRWQYPPFTHQPSPKDSYHSARGDIGQRADDEAGQFPCPDDQQCPPHALQHSSNDNYNNTENDIGSRSIGEVAEYSRPTNEQYTYRSAGDDLSHRSADEGSEYFLPHAHQPPTNDDFPSAANNIGSHSDGETAEYTPSYNQPQYASIDIYHNPGNDIGHLGEAAEYYSGAYMGENEHQASQVSPLDREAEGEEYGSASSDSDGVESSNEKATREIEEEEADGGCGCCGGDDNDGGCCGGFWSCDCCGDGEENHDGHDGHGEEESHDGYDGHEEHDEEHSSSCTIM